MEKKEFLTTSEVAKILNINEKKVYALAQKGSIPGTKITGKWIFPYKELTTFLKYNALKNLKKGVSSTLLENGIILGGGSDDPILTKIFSKFHNKEKINLFYTTVGSKNGIELLKNRVVHFAFSHLYDEKENKFNVTYLKKNFPSNDFLIINFFKREIGIVSNYPLENLEQINKRKFSFVLRQQGSGIRTLSEQFFKTGKLSKKNLKFFEHEINTHFDLVTLIKEHENLIGIATKSSAKIFSLHFLKIFDEHFDLITLKEYFFEKNFQKLYNFILNDIKNNFKKLDGYDFSSSGILMT